MKLVENVGSADRAIRLAISAVIVILFISDLIESQLAAVLLSLSAILTLEALVGFCPLYKVFGIDTRKRTSI